jgi:hypothetical protein
MAQSEKRHRRWTTAQCHAAWRRAFARFETARDDEIANAEYRLLAATDRLMSAPVKDAADLELKIGALLEMAAALVGDTTDFPWPQLRRVVRAKGDVPQRS